MSTISAGLIGIQCVAWQSRIDAAKELNLHLATWCARLVIARRMADLRILLPARPEVPFPALAVFEPVEQDHVISPGNFAASCKIWGRARPQQRTLSWVMIARLSDHLVFPAFGP